MRDIFGTIIIMALLICSGCVRPLRVDGPYTGKVIDAQTNKPLEGVVVDATWSRHYANVAGGSSAYYDTRETLTDKNGEFRIPGMGLLILSTIDKPAITLFKAGYDGEGPTYWESFDKKYIVQYAGRITREDGKLVFRFKKLSMDERRNTTLFPPGVSPDAPRNKVRLYRSEYNKEMLEIGRPASTLLPVE